MPVAKKWKGPSISDLIVNELDHRLYENQPRVGGHSTQLKGQIIHVRKVLSNQEKLLKMRIQACGSLVPMG